MKIMIRSDIEGVTGVTTYQQAEGTEFGRSMLMNDLRACIEGILATGEHEIVVYDEHTNGRNIDISQLPECTVNNITPLPFLRASSILCWPSIVTYLLTYFPSIEESSKISMRL